MPDSTTWVSGVRWERLREVSIVSANFARLEPPLWLKVSLPSGGPLLFRGCKQWPALPVDKQHLWRWAVWSLLDILKTTVMAFMISAGLKAHQLFCSNGRPSEGKQKRFYTGCLLSCRSGLFAHKISCRSLGWNWRVCEVFWIFIHGQANPTRTTFLNPRHTGL